MSLPAEAWIFGFICGLALFLRIFKIGEAPEGVYYDVGALGVHSLRLLHEGWKPPFMLPTFAANPSYILYGLAFWFRWLEPNAVHLLLFFALFSVLALPFVYWTLRQLSGPRVALTSVYLLAVMRWDLIYARNGFRGTQVLFYMFVTMSFLLYGMRSGKKWPFLLSALFFAGGLYTYQAYKAFPLLILACLIYEAFQNRENFRSQIKNIAVFWFVFFTLTWPVFLYWVHKGSLGSRESQLFIGTEIIQQGSLQPLVSKLAQTALMFNYKAHRVFKDIPMLDDVTGILFVLGIFYALGRIRERPFFYAVAGFFIMSLPGILSSDLMISHRMLGAIPFIAFLAAQSLWAIRQKLAPSEGSHRFLLTGFFLGILALAGLENMKTYIDEVTDCDSLRIYSTEATVVGKEVHGHPGTFYYLMPAFYYHPTVQFLAYFDSRRVGKLDFGNLWKKPFPTTGRDICFVLDEGKKPTLDFLKKTYPQGTEGVSMDPCGRPLAYFYSIPIPRKPFSFDRGLKGEYFAGLSFQGVPVETRWDPLVNFTNIGDFAVAQRPLSARWVGKLEVEKSGTYEFLVLTSDSGKLLLDHRQVVDTQNSQAGKVFLNRGIHSLELTAQRADNPDVDMDFHLLWKRPGQNKYEVVPNSVLGKIPRPAS